MSTLASGSSVAVASARALFMLGVDTANVLVAGS